ncbi:hypothetical protein COO60DRAFT_1703701 [Scenedesmus sp. NREL 46B-D3]|nr:hypothetical protein COO60DRAFT_1703701 [Scenedesmus sp. NREL 46B-D3]
MGVLYWQLNDIAAIASWSGYDYEVKRMYANLQVQAVQDGSQTKVFLVNGHASLVNTIVTVRVLSLTDSADATACAAQQPAAVFQTVVAPLFAEMSAMSPQEETSQAQMFLTPLKDINLPNPELELSEFRHLRLDRSAESGSAEAAAVSFTLKSNRPAVLTNFNTKMKGRFNDDAFTALHPCQPQKIVFHPHTSVASPANDASVITPGGYAMGVSTSTPGGYALEVDVTSPAGYAQGAPSVTPGGCALGDAAAAAEVIDLGDARAAACATAATSELSHRLGFRTVELVRLPIAEAVKDLFPAGKLGWDVDSTSGVSITHWDGSWALTKEGRWDHIDKSGNQSDIEGESFYFKVNGVPMYMKGANLVPLHILPTNVGKAAVDELMQYAL